MLTVLDYAKGFFRFAIKYSTITNKKEQKISIGDKLPVL